MRYFTFQRQFHQSIIDGIKRSTIRPTAKLRVGEQFALRFWTGSPYRSKMGILGTATCCEVSSVIIGPGGIGINDCHIDPEPLAIQEGFRSSNDMRAWFVANHGPIFNGWIHVWEKFCLPNAPVDRAGGQAPAKQYQPDSGSGPTSCWADGTEKSNTTKQEK